MWRPLAARLCPMAAADMLPEILSLGRDVKCCPSRCSALQPPVVLLLTAPVLHRGCFEVVLVAIACEVSRQPVSSWLS